MAGLLDGLAFQAELAEKKMKELGAVSEETAKKHEDLGFEEWILNHYFAKICGIKRTKDGRYYVESEK